MGVSECIRLKSVGDCSYEIRIGLSKNIVSSAHSLRFKNKVIILFFYFINFSKARNLKFCIHIKLGWNYQFQLHTMPHLKFFLEIKFYESKFKSIFLFFYSRSTSFVIQLYVSYNLFISECHKKYIADSIHKKNMHYSSEKCIMIYFQKLQKWFLLTLSFTFQ